MEKLLSPDRKSTEQLAEEAEVLLAELICDMIWRYLLMKPPKESKKRLNIAGKPLAMPAMEAVRSLALAKPFARHAVVPAKWPLTVAS